MKVVFDTSVLAAAALSREGASFALVNSIPTPKFQLCLSGVNLAFAAGCRYIVTHNVKDFDGSEQVGVKAVTPGEFLSLIGRNQ